MPDEIIPPPAAAAAAAAADVLASAAVTAAQLPTEAAKAAKELLESAKKTADLLLHSATSNDVHIQIVGDHLRVVETSVKDVGERVYRIEVRLPLMELANKLIFGFVGLVLVSFASALVLLVIKK